MMLNLYSDLNIRVFRYLMSHRIKTNYLFEMDCLLEEIDLRKCRYFQKNNSYYIDTENITLDNIDIEIKDENENIIDFCNLSYKLEFKIYFSNEDLKIEDTPNIENIMDSDDSESNLSIDSPDVSISNIQVSY